ncbi:MAG: hypothetical protein IPH06_13700 [Alphaproteobacteria bacterium]|nr:hypothetical protein [Alphaproteobacteria bacterium]
MLKTATSEGAGAIIDPSACRKSTSASRAPLTERTPARVTDATLPLMDDEVFVLVAREGGEGAAALKKQP